MKQTKQILTILLFISFATLYADKTKIYYSHKDIKETPELGSVYSVIPQNIDQFLLCDIDHHQPAELILYYYAKHKYISIRTIDNQSLREIALTSEVCGLFSLDVNDDGFDEIIYFTKSQLTVYLNIFDYHNHRDIQKHHPLIHGADLFKDNVVWDVTIRDVKKLEHSSGFSYLLVSVSAGHDKYPRGVYAYDITNFNLIWKFETGGFILDKIIPYDLDKDGKNEIFFSTVSTTNKVEINGSSDSLSYVFILDENGQEIYCHKINAPFTYSYFHINETTNQALIYAYTNKANRIQPDYTLLNLNHLPDTLRVKRENRNLKEVVFGENQIVNKFGGLLKGRYNYFHIWNEQFKITETVEFENQIEFITSDDLNFDGENEYIVILKQDEDKRYLAVVLDNQLNLIGHHLIEDVTRGLFVNNTHFHSLDFIYQSSLHKKLKYWRIPISQLKPISMLKSLWLKHHIFIVVIIILLLMVLILTAFLYLINKKNYRINKFHQLARHLIENPEEPLLIINESGIIEEYNQSFLQLFKLTPQTIEQDKSYVSLFKSIGDNQFCSIIEKSLQTDAAAELISKDINMVIYDENRKFKLNTYKVEISKHNFLLIFHLIDLTNFTRDDRVAAWAAMAQKLAHEIKNPLMSITLSLGRLEKRLRPGQRQEPEIEKYLTFIREEIDSMRDRTNQLMRFTSSINFQFGDYDISELILETARPLEQASADRIHFTYKLAPDLIAYIDKEQTKQVVINIIENAIDAIEGSGEISIKSTHIEQLDAKNGQIVNYTQIEFSDSGIGIAFELLAKVFEPNFTTKKTGSGFGLAIARHIIEEQNGTINIHSKPDVGTTITIELPLTSTGI